MDQTDRKGVGVKGNDQKIAVTELNSFEVIATL